jgi:hypothetical protein
LLLAIDGTGDAWELKEEVESEDNPGKVAIDEVVLRPV